jgi:hypothetical protein
MPLNNWYIERLYTVTAGTLRANPLVLPDKLGDVWCNDVNVRIPPGHCGQTGIQIEYAGVPIVPWNDANAFIIDDDKDYPFDVGMEFDQSLTVTMFNVGTFDHTFYVRWNVTAIVLKLPTIVAGLVPIVQSTQPSSGFQSVVGIASP